ncbi:hypothetical protein PybrP1_006647, partial [[Pythium] brassicae (nom. inval.)]
AHSPPVASIGVVSPADAAAENGGGDSAAVNEEVWAKAIHAVKAQKMSLRQAAQVYGVHHMALHRRVRGRYATSVAASFDIRAYLSEDDESEVLGVLREQFLHEKRITSDDIRFVVRAIASHGGSHTVPPEFPPSRWIVAFKRAHGFAKLNSYAAYARYAVPTFSRAPHEPPGYHNHNHNHHFHAPRSSDHEPTPQWEQNSDGDREDFGSSRSTVSYDNGATTGSSCSSFENGERATGSATSAAASTSGDNSEPLSQQQQQQQGEQPDQQEQRSYKLSHTVPPETWEKAIAAVEQQGMSLRAAARAYGVHFAALHRRVKKRAQGGDSGAPGTPLEGYFHPDDESGITRVVVARAELGVLMTFDELMDLVQRAALRNLPDISVDAARKLMARFQSRNEHSIRHIIVDWPLPRISLMSLNGGGGGRSKGSSVSSSSSVAGGSSSSRAARGGTSARPAVIVRNSGGLPPSMSMGMMGMNGGSSGSGSVLAPPLPSAQSLLLRSQQQAPLPSATVATTTTTTVVRRVPGDKSMFV